jgi:hypothetical protein
MLTLPITMNIELIATLGDTIRYAAMGLGVSRFSSCLTNSHNKRVGLVVPA